MRVISGFAFASAVIIMSGAIVPAHAIDAQVARTCDALVARAFPPREPGNPASGSARGGAKDQRDYFNKCVANGGKSIEDPPGWREGGTSRLYLAYLRDPYGNKICALHRG